MQQMLHLVNYVRACVHSKQYFPFVFRFQIYKYFHIEEIILH